MNKLFKALLVIIGIIILCSAVGAAIDSASSVSDKSPVDNMTKSQYLALASNNGEKKGYYCIYEYLIDNYGLKETYAIDQRADVDKNDIDGRVFEAIIECGVSAEDL